MLNCRQARHSRHRAGCASKRSPLVPGKPAFPAPRLWPCPATRTLAPMLAVLNRGSAKRPSATLFRLRQNRALIAESFSGNPGIRMAVERFDEPFSLGGYLERSTSGRVVQVGFDDAFHPVNVVSSRQRDSGTGYAGIFVIMSVFNPGNAFVLMHMTIVVSTVDAECVEAQQMVMTQVRRRNGDKKMRVSRSEYRLRKRKKALHGKSPLAAGCLHPIPRGLTALLPDPIKIGLADFHLFVVDDADFDLMRAAAVRMQAVWHVRKQRIRAVET